MLRIFIFLLIVLLLAAGFAWVAERPGEVLLEWQGTQYQTSLMVVVAGIVILVAAIMITWWLVRALLDSPGLFRRYWKNRKKDRGYEALSRGLIAANAGDAHAARLSLKQSTKLIGGNEPLVGLLDAQTALLEGKHEKARERFEDMLTDENTRLVALRGLYAEAEKQGSPDAARHYAAEAHKAAPTLAWAGNAEMRFACLDGDWEKALRTLDSNRTAGLLDKEEAKRKKAVLLTAQAMAEEPADPVKAAKLAREAHKLAGDFVPAAVIAAKALSRNSDLARAAGILETVWKKQPHPEIAESYVHLRIGDSAIDRLKRARKLAAMRPNHPEGNIAVAQAAIEAQEWKVAREALKPVLTSRPTEKTFLLMADVEEGEYGDKGRMRDLFSRAVRAPRDPVWTADGYVSEQWLPVSPLTGKLDAFEWKVPTEAITENAAVIEAAEGLEGLLAEPELAPVEDEREEHDKGVLVGETAPLRQDKPSVDPVRIDNVEEAVLVEETASEKDRSQGSNVEKSASKTGEEMSKTVSKPFDDESQTARTTQLVPENDDETEQEKRTDHSGQVEKPSSGTGEPGKGGDRILGLDQRPDDPGVRSDEKTRKKEASSRFF